MADEGLVRVYLKTDTNVELADFANALDSLSHQYQVFVRQKRRSLKGAEPSLSVVSVSKGSVDLSLLPELVSVGMSVYAAGGSAYASQLDLALQFLDYLGPFFKKFLKANDDVEGITIRDCNDVTQITKPVAQNGGTQIFNVYQGNVTNSVSININIDRKDATKIIRNAAHKKALIQQAEQESYDKVRLVWSQLDRDKARLAGKRSSDRGLIRQIDPIARPVFFSEEMADLKAELVSDDDNPYQQEYIVDVQVSRVRDRISQYRVVGYHGAESL